MVKKNNTTMIVVILLVVLGVFLLIPRTMDGKVPESESVNGAISTGCALDGNGNCISVANPFATVTFEGEEPTIGTRFIRIFNTLTTGGSAPFITVNSITGSPALYNSEIQNQMTTSFVLNQGEINNQTVDVDFTDPSIPFGITPFQFSVEATFKDAQGNNVPITPTPTATINILKEDDSCVDGTPWGTCSPNKPTYCEPGILNDPYGPDGVLNTSDETFYQPGQLVNKATICGCPTDYVQDPTNPDLCTLNACSDGTIVSQCSSATNTNTRYCTSSKTLVEAGSTCGCTNDFYGNPSTGTTNPGAIDGTDTCQYQTYTGTIDVTIGSGGGSPPSSTVNFRTTDLQYPSSGAIAFTLTCGNELVRYGYEVKTTSSTSNCDDDLSPNGGFGSLLLQNLPGSINTGGDGNLRLYSDVADSSEYWLCENDADGSGKTSNRYDSSDASGSGLSTSSSVLDSSRELTC